MREWREEVQRRLSFPLSGPAEQPGVIVMSLDGTGLDARWSRIVVVFNATDAPASPPIPEPGRLRPHPELTSSADPVLRAATPAEIPARSVAVFVTDIA